MKKTLVIAIILIFLSILLAFWLQKKIVPLTDSMVQAKAQYIGNQIINDCVANNVTNDDINNIFTLEKNDSGQIIAEDTNTVEINLLKSKLHNALNDDFNSIENSSFNIPIGNLVGIDWLSTYGPKLYVKLIFYGNISADINDEFTSAGINQTKHTYFVDTKAEVKAIVSGRIITCEIDNNIPIAETIILGTVPQVSLSNVLPTQTQ